jgi:hypothetical protein
MFVAIKKNAQNKRSRNGEIWSPWTTFKPCLQLNFEMTPHWVLTAVTELKDVDTAAKAILTSTQILL